MVCLFEDIIEEPQYTGPSLSKNKTWLMIKISKFSFFSKREKILTSYVWREKALVMR